eukprot:TRINITY_DN272_c0_g1_i1.p1 TRINITY_DN272_c0_g1~~TRINITY_DN272_c0_g1_i1.p1  ORF type:complete len:346 (-),score=87.39 TRINITY_DN272_c0_g1_i1:108-1145(-)
MLVNITKQASRLSTSRSASWKRFASNYNRGGNNNQGRGSNYGSQFSNNNSKTATSPNSDSSAASTPSESKGQGSFFKSIFGSGSSSAAASAPSNLAGPTSQSAASSGDNNSTFSTRGSSSNTNESELQNLSEKYNFADVSTRYAYLLYTTFRDEKALNAIDGEVQKLEDLYKNNTTFQDIIDDDLMSNKGRETALLKIIETANLHPATEAFLVVLASNNRIASLPDILDDLESIKKRVSSNTHVARVVSAKPLTDTEKSEIRTLIRDTFKTNSVDLVEELDPSVGGGYELFYEDKYHLDNSKRTEMSELQEKIEASVNTYLSEVDEEQLAELEAARQTDSPATKA